MARKWYVLVVDDDPRVRLALKYNLGLDGFEVNAIGNTNDVFAVATERRPDLILLDRNMPEKDGLEVLGEIRGNSALRDILVFMLTCHRLIGDIEDAFARGADGYLMKPFDPVDLSKRLRTKLENLNPPDVTVTQASFEAKREVVAVTVKRRNVAGSWA